MLIVQLFLFRSLGQDASVEISSADKAAALHSGNGPLVLCILETRCNIILQIATRGLLLSPVWSCANVGASSD